MMPDILATVSTAIHLAGDTFEITTDGLEVCATRTDSGKGWVHFSLVSLLMPQHVVDDVAFLRIEI